jgi:hypothetical protein
MFPLFGGSLEVGCISRESQISHKLDNLKVACEYECTLLENLLVIAVSLGGERHDRSASCNLRTIERMAISPDDDLIDKGLNGNRALKIIKAFWITPPSSSTSISGMNFQHRQSHEHGHGMPCRRDCGLH